MKYEHKLTNRLLIIHWVISNYYLLINAKVCLVCFHSKTAEPIETKCDIYQKLTPKGLTYVIKKMYLLGGSHNNCN